jgi:hypothetical protein
MSLVDRSASEIRRLIASGDVSVREVVAASLARVDARNPELNAIVTLNPRALEDADALDARIAQGENLWTAVRSHRRDQGRDARRGPADDVRLNAVRRPHRA